MPRHNQRRPEQWRVKLSVTLDRDVLSRLDDASNDRGVSRSSLIERLLDAALPPAEKKSADDEKRY